MKEKSILSNKEITNKILNSFKEFIRFHDNLLNSGLVFEKKVTKFSKTSSAIYLPKRLIGKTFRIYLMPVDDGYEEFQGDAKAPKIELPNDTKIETKVEKVVEKVIEKPKEESRRNLLNPVFK